jgi:hypothetical protein
MKTTFLIQTIDNQIKHDFSFHLVKAIEFQNWLRENNELTYCLTEVARNPFTGGGNPECIYIPCGSIDFILDYIKHYYNLIPKPKNIPIELISYEFTGRNVINGTEKDIVGRKFVKSNDGFKVFAQICDKAPEGNYQISDYVDLQSEYRCFIFKNKLVGLSNYSGDFTVFPDLIKINNMIKVYTNAPIAYTLDVGITEVTKKSSSENTVIIEVHDFFSCGLYGFEDYRILPFMFSNWFRNYVNKNKSK